jgi:hypothetical protein
MQQIKKKSNSAHLIISTSLGSKEYKYFKERRKYSIASTLL